MERLTTFTRKLCVFLNWNYFFFTRFIRLRTVPYTWKFSPGENFCQFHQCMPLAKFLRSENWHIKFFYSYKLTRVLPHSISCFRCSKSLFLLLDLQPTCTLSQLWCHYCHISKLYTCTSGHAQSCGALINWTVAFCPSWRPMLLWFVCSNKLRPKKPRSKGHTSNLTKRRRLG